MLKPYKKIKSEVLLKNQYVTYIKDNFIAGNDKEGEYYYELRGDSVAIVAITKDNQLILVKEYKYPIQKFDSNLPAGGLKPEETPEAGAVRELFEETGYESKVEPVYLGKVAISPSRTTDYFHIVYLPECEFTSEPNGSEEIEETEVELIKTTEIWDFIENIKSVNCHTLVALTKACLYLEIHPK